MKELREFEASAPAPTLALALAKGLKDLGSFKILQVFGDLKNFKEFKNVKDAPLPPWPWPQP